MDNAQLKEVVTGMAPEYHDTLGPFIEGLHDELSINSSR